MLQRFIPNLNSPLGQMTEFFLSLALLVFNFILLLFSFIKLQPFSVTVVQTPYWFKVLDGFSTALLGVNCLLHIVGSSRKRKRRTFWYTADLLIVFMSLLPFVLYAQEATLMMGIP